MAISIDQIKHLRESTGVSMMSCKNALEETSGDFEKAFDLLRKKGEAKAADRAGRSTGQGAVVVKSDGGRTAMVQLLCETDFVARGDEFLKLGDVLAAKLLKGEIQPEDRDISEVKDAVLRLGENIQIGNMCLIEGENIGEYVHSNKKIGVLISLKGGDKELSKDLAMHIAAINPQFISPDEVSSELVEREKGIWADQLKNEGKPAEIIEKIMMGKEKKFREENALLTQMFVKDPEKSIAELVKSGNASVEKFYRFGV